MHSQKIKNNGFTLIELMVVVSMITFIASITLVNLVNARIKAKDVVRVLNKEQIKKALVFVKDETGSFPKSGSGSGPTYPEACIAGTTDTCFGGALSGYDGLKNALAPYVSGDLLNKPYSNNPKDGLAFSSNEAWPLDSSVGSCGGAYLCGATYQVGDSNYYPFIVWMQEKGMNFQKAGPCPVNDGHSFVSSYNGVFLCHEWLQPY